MQYFAKQQFILQFTEQTGGREMREGLVTHYMTSCPEGPALGPWWLGSGECQTVSRLQLS